MNRSIIYYALLIVGSFSASISFSQQKLDAETINKLRDVSAQMSDEGNTNQIMVELMIDGFIRDGESSDLSLKDSILLLNGKTLPAELQSKYALLMKPYTRKETSHGPTVAEMLDPKSGFRKIHKPEDFKMPNYDAVIAEMCEDGIVSPKEHIEIVCNWKGIVVNGKKLKAAAERKYRKVFLDTSGTAFMKKTESARISHGAPHKTKAELADGLK